MADKEASFAVRLVDRASKPARSIAAAMRRISTAARVANKSAASRAMGSRSAGMHAALPKQRDNNKIGKLIDKQIAQVGRLSTALLGAAARAAALTTALAGIGAGFVMRGIVMASAHAERMQSAFASLTGSAASGQAAFKRSGQLAAELGLNVEETAEKYAKLLAAQFSASRAETLIKLSADLRAIGSSAEEANSAIRAITQIKAKGRLQAEELVGQLAEAGVATTLVYESLGRTMGKTQAQVIKAITAGAVSADMGIAAIEEAILKKVGTKKAGVAGKRAGEKLLDGMLNRLKNAPTLLFQKIGEAAGRGPIKGLVKQLTSVVESIDPAAAAVAFNSVIALASTAVKLGVEFGKGFSESFASIARALAVGDVGQAAKRFRELGRDVGRITELAIGAAKAVGKLVMWLTSDTGRWTVGVVALTLASVKLTAALGVLGTTFGATAGAGVLARMGSFGLGAAMVGKSVAWLTGLLVAGTKVVAAWGAAAAVAAAPFALVAAKVALVAAAGVAAYKAMSKLLELTGASQWLENIGASLAGPAIPRAAHRGLGPAQGSAEAAMRTFSPKFGPVQGSQATIATSAAPSPNVKAGDVHIANMTIPISGAGMRDPKRFATDVTRELRNQLGEATAAATGG